MMETPETPKKSLLIVFEGIDGSGKSTLARAVAVVLTELGIKRAPIVYSFPTRDRPIGKLIRSMFTSPEPVVAPEAMAYLFVADGLDMENAIRCDLEAPGRVVVEDRHPTISGWVYQQETHDLQTIMQIQTQHLFRPADMVFILDVPVSVALERRAARGLPTEMYEKGDTDYLERLRGRYMAYHMLYDNTCVLDGTQPTSALVDDVIKAIKELREP